jgi:ribosomal protein L19E
MWFDSSRCLKPNETKYYLNKEDFDYLIEDNICDLQYELDNRVVRIELVMVDDGSRPYQMAVRNSELNKELLEHRAEIEKFWGEKIRLFRLSSKKYRMDNDLDKYLKEEIKKFHNHLIEEDERPITDEVYDELYSTAKELMIEYDNYEKYVIQQEWLEEIKKFHYHLLEKETREITFEVIDELYEEAIKLFHEYEDYEHYEKDNIILKNHLKK